MTCEQRWHPLWEESVIITAHRQDRPWIGDIILQPEQKLADYDPSCYLSTGNRRVNGQLNLSYQNTFVLYNDHACVNWEAPGVEELSNGVHKRKSAHGSAKVVCCSSKHNLTLAELKEEEVVKWLTVWQEQYLELGANPQIEHVLIFENKEEVVGVSNLHPHCQIYSTNFVFKFIETEARVSTENFRKNKITLFQEIPALKKPLTACKIEPSPNLIRVNTRCVTHSVPLLHHQ